MQQRRTYSLAVIELVRSVIRYRRSTKRWILIISIITLGLMYYQSSTVIEITCSVLDVASCGRTLGDERARAFRGLSFKEEHGIMYYPAESATGSSSLVTRIIKPVRSPPQAHPIHLLMEEAERNWTTKLSKQSKTLKQTVAEYERRYGIRPPRGFANWYWFAKGKEVSLIDEYDSIYDRILPFLALPPSVLKERSAQLQEADKGWWMYNNAFTIEMREGYSRIVGPMAETNPRPHQMSSLLDGFAKFLPDMNITITGHDSPWVVLSGEARAAHIAAAKSKRLLTPEEYSNPMDQFDHDGFAVICPSDSPLRNATYYEERKANWKDLPKQNGFIRDHVAAMNPCDHPERQGIHGFTSWPGPRPGLLYPLFTSSTTALHSDLLLPPVDQFDYPQGDDVAWSRKSNEKVIWRGTTTGADLTIEHMRKYSQRVRLLQIPNQEGSLTLPLSPFDTISRPGLTTSFSASIKALASHYLDFGFLAPPQQCGSIAQCKAFVREGSFQWKDYMTTNQQNSHKYVVDVDGNGWSGRFHRLMSSNAVVLKSTIFPEWYAERIQPWVHYVPLSTDYDDLFPIMAFFRGDLSGAGAHDDLAEKIAANAKSWAGKFWRWDDLEIYFFRLLLEYARLMERNEDGSGMDM